MEEQKKKSNRGRPELGMEFTILDPQERYRTGNFQMHPTKESEAIFQRHEDGETIAEIAEQIGKPETHVKRTLRNLRRYYDAQQEERLKRISLGLPIDRV